MSKLGMIILSPLGS